VVRGRKGEYRKELAELMKKGFQRVKVDGQYYEIADVPPLDKKYKHDIDIVVDRIVVRSDIAARLADSLETCLRLADGLAIAEFADKPLPDAETSAGGSANKSLNETHERMLFSEKFACPVSGFTISEIEPRLFSFNNPHGACPTCDGLGTQKTIDEALIVPEQNLTLRGGAIAPWAKSSRPITPRRWKPSASISASSCQTAGTTFPPRGRMPSCAAHRKRSPSSMMTVCAPTTSKTSRASFPIIERRWRKQTAPGCARKSSATVEPSCPACDGYRLKPEALARSRSMAATSARLPNCRSAWPTTGSMSCRRSSDQQNQIAVRILKEIRERLKFLNDVGLDYLTLSRNSGTLSGGESQRIRLASQIGSGLTGVLYVLDEPSIGLHQRDNDRLLERCATCATSATPSSSSSTTRMRSARPITSSTSAPAPASMAARSSPRARRKTSWPTRSLDHRQYLSGERARSRCPPSAARADKKEVTVVGPRGNNLKNVTADGPARRFTCVTGVSGGGKSTLPDRDALQGRRAPLNGARARTPAPDSIDGLEHLDKVIDIDQSPIGRTPRSNPATYTGAFTPIRDWFAGLPEAKARGYKPGRFSFNVKGGRCEACQGDGVIKIEMHFLPDVYVTCDQSARASATTARRSSQFKGKSIADVLDMTVEEGCGLLRRRAADPRQAGELHARRPRLHQGRPAGDDALGRRGAARQAGQGALEALDRPHALHPRRTDHGPAFRRCRASSWKCCTNWSTRAIRSWSSSTISTSSRPPTGSSTSAPKAAMAAADRRRRHARGLPASRSSGMFDDFRKEMDRMMERFFGDAATTAAARTGFPSLTTVGAVRPAIDITENDKAITLTAELPGMSEEEVDLTVSDGVLTLKGEKNVSHESKQDHSVVIERNYGSFYRSFPVPDQVDQDEIAAKFDKGVLTVTMPKKPGSAKTERRIKVRS
jgi:excinuclease ABC subunit A